jgi:hypothetical protein
VNKYINSTIIIRLFLSTALVLFVVGLSLSDSLKAVMGQENPSVFGYYFGSTVKNTTSTAGKATTHTTSGNIIPSLNTVSKLAPKANNTAVSCMEPSSQCLVSYVLIQ